MSKMDIMNCELVEENNIYLFLPFHKPQNVKINFISFTLLTFKLLYLVYLCENTAQYISWLFIQLLISPTDPF